MLRCLIALGVSFVAACGGRGLAGQSDAAADEVTYLNRLSAKYPPSTFFLGVGEVTKDGKTPAQTLEQARLEASAGIARAIQSRLTSVVESMQSQNNDTSTESVSVSVRAEAQLDPRLTKHIQDVPGSSRCTESSCRVARILPRDMLFKVYAQQYDQARRVFLNHAGRAQRQRKIRRGFAGPYRRAADAYEEMQVFRQRIALLSGIGRYQKRFKSDDKAWRHLLVAREQEASKDELALHVTGIERAELRHALLGTMGQVFSQAGMRTRASSMCAQGIKWIVKGRVKVGQSRLMGMRCSLNLDGQLVDCRTGATLLNIALDPKSLGFSKTDARQLRLAALGRTANEACENLDGRVTLARFERLLKRALGSHLPL
ncbi:MAG: hypothetical protein VX589_00980 [Myxococcota bacterium]|nr:hypothetical protein [Myxococcota bacterium]